ncbi:ribosome maturation protein [Tuber borchii]|uniref:Ribosome maturation protein n=1 Tax=Tuber borchii TaxID=42251 RepID=A0A2T7A624_TUBBO|nr:ribosome maturation protein [Tuber borchii]
MTRGSGEQTKVIYKGKNEDFIVFVESVGNLNKWRSDPSIPLVDVVDSFKVFRTHKHGVQGILDEAGGGLLEDEFGTKKEDDVVKKILQDGSYQRGVADERQGDRNVSNGPMQAQGYIA